MEKLKSIFPLSFRGKGIGSMFIAILFYIIIGLVLGAVCWLVGKIPMIGDLASWLVGVIAGIYELVGIVLAVLHFLKVV